jgi:hypothetical protein
MEGEALDRAVWRTGFRRGCGPATRQTAELMIDLLNVTLPTIYYEIRINYGFK